MRAVIQRVTEAHVDVDGVVVGAIGRGLLVYLGAERGDGERDEEYVTSKIAGLRVFPDADGKMSLAVRDIDGGILVVPQFTLFGDVRTGRRPSFDGAAPPESAERHFRSILERLGRSSGVPVASGRFRADMRVHGVVDGPVTILVDSRKLS